MIRSWVLVGCILVFGACAGAADSDPLAIGTAGHAFDHLSGIADQADAATASGANIIYATGVGGLGYAGLPPADQLKDAQSKAAAYLQNAKASGVRLAIGYVCATSIVKLDTFDQNWPADLKAQLSSPPAKWLQQGRDGKPLPSWYGGDYRPACMSNPDWRTYEKFIVRMQLAAGQDGIFFDNPTVHPEGCYCESCMKGFRKFLVDHGAKLDASADGVEFLRTYAQQHSEDFLRFRSTIAADFMSEMRAFARTINPKALITCNNSLNAPDAFYSQCRTYGYSIDEMSKVEDLVVVEDMATQPRVLPDGTAVEYGPIYEMLQAISHRKPLVAVTIADGDYHTPPNLVRLAMAEAAAHGASNLWWPTWPENERKRMIEVIRPEADFLREHADLLNDTTPRADVWVYLPFHQWVRTADCPVLKIVRALSPANIQFRVVSDEDLSKSDLATIAKTLVVESKTVLSESGKQVLQKFESAGGHVAFADQPNWLGDVQKTVKNRITLPAGPLTVRAVVREKSGKTIVHLLNLNVQRLSSFQDRVTPAANVRLQLICQTLPKKAAALSADADATRGAVDFKTIDDHTIELTLPRVDVSTILVIE